MADQKRKSKGKKLLQNDRLANRPLLPKECCFSFAAGNGNPPYTAKPKTKI